jgi:hypothetical protein
MPERFVQLGGASVNARKKRSTYWLLGIFDTVGCPLVVYTDSSGLFAKFTGRGAHMGLGKLRPLSILPCPAECYRGLGWRKKAPVFTSKRPMVMTIPG